MNALPIPTTGAQGASNFDLPDYQAIVDAIKARREELGLTTMQVDTLAGLPAGYTSKVECWKPYEDDQPHRASKITWRTMGLISLPLLMTALGLKLQFELVDPPEHIQEILDNDIY